MAVYAMMLDDLETAAAGSSNTSIPVAAADHDGSTSISSQSQSLNTSILQQFDDAGDLSLSWITRFAQTLVSGDVNTNTTSSFDQPDQDTNSITTDQYKKLDNKIEASLPAMSSNAAAEASDASSVTSPMLETYGVKAKRTACEAELPVDFAADDDEADSDIEIDAIENFDKDVIDKKTHAQWKGTDGVKKVDTAAKLDGETKDAVALKAANPVEVVVYKTEATSSRMTRAKTSEKQTPSPKKQPSPPRKRRATPTKKAKLSAVNISNQGNDQASSHSDSRRSSISSVSTSSTSTDLILMEVAMPRKARIVTPSNPRDAALIAAAGKAGSDIYESDTESPVPLNSTKKPELFLNVVWGPAATNFSGPDSDFPTHPEFSQFVPGRWERLPDGSVRDQKAKLVVKLTDTNGARKIFANPVPKDWSCQETISRLNKRTVQQLRRNTPLRFRPTIVQYVQEEREWILSKLIQGKPPKGWTRFVNEFNAQFAGRVLDGIEDARPTRSHSSMTKEIDRFGPDFYARGLLPPTK